MISTWEDIVSFVGGLIACYALGYLLGYMNGNQSGRRQESALRDKAERESNERWRKFVESQ